MEGYVACRACIGRVTEGFQRLGSCADLSWCRKNVSESNMSYKSCSLYNEPSSQQRGSTEMALMMHALLYDTINSATVRHSS
jgi:hypothetical protein